MNPGEIEASLSRIRATLPEEVLLVAAAKSRTVDEVEEALRVGVTTLGHNYVQEAEPMIAALGERAKWHLIGHLQKNKVKKAVALFDLIETVDSWVLAEQIEWRCAVLDKTMEVLVEINSGREAGKTGVLPEEAEDLIRRMADLPHVRVQGLMTMGPSFGDPEEARPYFRATKKVFDRIAEKGIPGVDMRTLSMGMSNSYEVAIEEGANLVRIGTKLFGSRAVGKASDETR
ncbi:MAG: YggS family pyridoxal phosphate-dependent enzyme [Candidatus Latescibacterota bacterium]